MDLDLNPEHPDFKDTKARSRRVRGWQTRLKPCEELGLPPSAADSSVSAGRSAICSPPFQQMKIISLREHFAKIPFLEFLEIQLDSSEHSFKSQGSICCDTTV